MPSAVVEAAFRDRLEDNWDLADGIIIGSNDNFAPPSDGSAFLLIQYPIAENTRAALTRRRFEEGAARIVLNAPSGDGLPTWLAKADAIAAVFRGDKLKIGSSENVEVFEPSPPVVNNDSDEANYFSLAVIVPYRFQFDWSVNSPTI